MNEMIKFWLIDLYNGAIEETKGTIANNRLCILGASNAEEERMFIQNETDMKAYIEVLKKLKTNVEEN